MKPTPAQYHISPEAIAYKIAAMRNFYTPNFAAQVKQHPEMLQVLRAVLWFSKQPGGLVKFAQDFLEMFPHRVGTPAMRRIGQKALSKSDRDAILREIPRYGCSAATPAGRAAAAFFDALDASDSDCFRPRPCPDAVKKLDYAGFRALCLDAALDDLPWRLAQFCGLPDAPETLADRHWHDDKNGDIEGEDRCLEDVWYFENLPGSMIEMLANHAQRVRDAKLAPTEISERVITAFQFALEENAAVCIQGDTRAGKTHTAVTVAEMWPGVARVVRTPCSNVQFDFLRAIADALGIEVPLSMTRRELQRKVEFVIQHGGFFIIFDEAHYVFPRLVSRNTDPARLNWIRENLMDRHCPMALVSTPQEFSHSLNRFVKTTNHNILQFQRRIAETVILSPESGEDDLMNVARLHFPDLPEAYLQLIVGKALQTEKGLATVEHLAKHLRFIARHKGHPRPTTEDLDQAIAKVIGPAPSTAPAPAPARTATCTAPSRPIAIKRGRPAIAPSGARPALQAPVRGTSPADAPDFDPPARQTAPLTDHSLTH